MSDSSDSLPVFVFPTQLIFYVKDVNTHRHIMTIYNPYDFAVCFQIMCTAPGNYSVMEPQGIIKPRCCVDIAIRRLNLPSPSSNSSSSSSATFTSGGYQVGRADKLRVCVRRRDRPTTSGHRDVTAELYVDRRHRDRTSGGGGGGAGTNASGLPPGTGATEFSNWPSGGADDASTTRPSATSSLRHYPMPSGGGSGRRGEKSTWPLIFVASICVLCLSAPGADSEWLKSMEFPDWLALTSTQKLVAAYVLGLVTSALLLQQ